MTNKFMQIIGASALSISLITGVASVASANENALSEVGTEDNVFTPSAIQNKNFELDLLKNTKADPYGNWTIQIGYPHINLYVKNTGSQSFRVEVKHKTKGTIIFNKTVEANGVGVNFYNNDANPLVPSGDYKVTVYGGTAIPKGTIIMKASDTPW
ncbi:hypothetical protein MHB85_00980 [Paenibacillus sp. FSL K6-4396]|uniref:hypothetical protein n=1 Tax=unclassified Paenibacillus TaxID=185978 RepID=UPI001781E95A|nr:hypothetical protein [Paenibacillus sp. CFBP 13594]MBD8841786.1 hypothetical protein [Paenibacillus sp. CFBP 13594]